MRDYALLAAAVLATVVVSGSVLVVVASAVTCRRADAAALGPAARPQRDATDLAHRTVGVPDSFTVVVGLVYADGTGLRRAVALPAVSVPRQPGSQTPEEASHLVRAAVGDFLAAAGAPHQDLLVSVVPASPRSAVAH